MLMMITVDCRDVESIKHDLLVYVSDQVGAVPALKNHEFVLSSFNDDDQIDKMEVITSIKEFLDSIGESRNFAIIPRSDLIIIKSLNGSSLDGEQRAPARMFSCSHCGFVTQYEVEHNNHMKTHYL